jgi:hypothetical protein
MPPAIEILTGVYAAQRYRPADAHETGDSYLIGELEDGTTIKGRAPAEDMVLHLTYRFEGAWAEVSERDRKYGNGKPAFLFRSYTRAEPHSRHGLTHYLQKYCRGIGPQLAARLWDQYQGDACRILREDPGRVAREVTGVRGDVAADASTALQTLAKFEDARIDLMNLLAGRGFPGSLTEKAIKMWGVAAPEKIRRDPFCLLENDMPGAGWERVDRLYTELGLPADSPKRQMFCLWYIIDSNNDGHTWFFGRTLAEELGRRISSAHVDAIGAVNLGLSTGRLAIRRDERGQVWVAEAQAAQNEGLIAEQLDLLTNGPRAIARYSVALPGECGNDSPFLWSDGSFARPADEHAERTVLFDGEGGEIFEIAGRRIVVQYDHSQTPEAMAVVGKRTGICQFCGRRLTSQESKARGYGPICAANNGLPWGPDELGSVVDTAKRTFTEVPF